MTDESLKPLDQGVNCTLHPSTRLPIDSSPLIAHRSSFQAPPTGLLDRKSFSEWLLVDLWRPGWDGARSKSYVTPALGTGPCIFVFYLNRSWYSTSLGDGDLLQEVSGSLVTPVVDCIFRIPNGEDRILLIKILDTVINKYDIES
ncbi:MAG: hypothetical protein J3Q66DRAFT_393534 [Benniella sp.]|nr:MAG: hypothetical protein J3Q66DRAFT_393534 [Benniella sp.]